MNAALSVEPGAGSLSGFAGVGTSAVAQPAGVHSAEGRNAAWRMALGQNASGLADARNGSETRAFSEGANASWQSMLRAWGAGNGTTGETAGPERSDAAEAAATGATGERTNDHTNNQTIASFAQRDGAFTDLSRPAVPNSYGTAIAREPDAAEPRETSGRKVASEIDAQEPPGLPGSEAGGPLDSVHSANRKREEPVAQKEAPGQPGPALFAAAGDQNLAVVIPVPAAVQAPATPAELPAEAEFNSGTGLPDRMARRSSDTIPTARPRAVSEMGVVPSEPETAASPVSRASAHAQQRAITGSPAPQQIAESGIAAEPSDAKTGAVPVAPSPATYRDTLRGTIRDTIRDTLGDTQTTPLASWRVSGLRERKDAQPSMPAPLEEASRSTEGRELNAPVAAWGAPHQAGTSASNAQIVHSEALPQVDPGNSGAASGNRNVREGNAPAASGGAPRPGEAGVSGTEVDSRGLWEPVVPLANIATLREAGPKRSGPAQAPAAVGTNQPSLDSGAPVIDGLRNAAASHGKTGSVNSTGKKISTEVNAGVSPGVVIPESAQGAAVTKAGGAGVGDRAPSTSAREPFAELDLGTSVSAPKWIHAGGNQVEAGFEDPALGWIGVRADLSGGSVHASLVPATAEAGEILGAHMAGLSAYLDEQHSPVAGLTVADFAGGSGAAGADQHTQQGGGQDGEGGSSAHAERTPESGDRGTPAARPVAMQAGVMETVRPLGGSLGRHISVMA